MIKEGCKYYYYVVVKGVLKGESESLWITGDPVVPWPISMSSFLTFSTTGQRRNDDHVVGIVNIAHRIALLALAIIVVAVIRLLRLLGLIEQRV